MMKRALLIENHQLKSQIYILEMNGLQKEGYHLISINPFMSMWLISLFS
jgi:hypothetical protein